MKKTSIILIATAAILCGACGANPQGKNVEEKDNLGETNMSKIREEYNSYFQDLGNAPVSFRYGDRFFKGFNSEYFTKISEKKTNERNGEKTVTILKIENIEVTIESVLYENYDAYDYTVYFKNVGTENSRIFQSVEAGKYEIYGKNPHLVSILGDHHNSYAPYDYDLTKQNVDFISDLGRATHIYFPYFNLVNDSGCTMISIGWGGTWEAHFENDGDKTTFRGTGTIGMKTYLLPGEEIRTPLMAVVKHYENDYDAAQNKFRKWIVDCNYPKDHGGSSDLVVQPSTSTCFCNDTGRPNSDGSISEGYDSWRRSIDTIIDHDVNFTFRWFDAGWYQTPNLKSESSDWWGTVGTWVIDPIKWPNDTFKESVNYARDKNWMTLVWFEPERVTHLDGMVANFEYDRTWVLSDHGNNNTFLNNLGNKDCLEWTTDRILTFMEKNEIDLYREDFNLDPYLFWNIGDAEQGSNRIGITENLYMQGHYQLWDNIIEYQKNHDRCTYVDSCASGGGRNDLESVRRSVPFLRSDSDRTTIPLRLAYTYSVNKWLPYSGVVATDSQNQLAAGLMDTYSLRAAYQGHMSLSQQWYHNQDNIQWDALRKALNEYERVSKFFYCDYYNLTPYTNISDDTHWNAYEYFDKTSNKGVIQAFRQASCEDVRVKVKVKGVDPTKYYSVVDEDGKQSIGNILGSDLIKGITISAEKARTAILLFINPIN